ncbi:MAG: hypothetical protein LBD59_05285, partial [Prevotellaceae bacterium]|nr:hypothetical protein [Prevotellaceae bacterium]
MKRGLIISVCVCLSSILQAQILYDFEANLDGWIQKPANSWTRTMSNNYVLSGTASLRHDRTGANTDSIFIPISGIAFENHDITWKFLLRHGYNPSGTNKWAVILAANSTANQFSGYAVGVNMKTGTTDDLLCLYQVNAGVFSEICKTNINWQDLVGIGRAEAVEIRRDEHGIWTIGSGENFSSISFYAQTISNTAYSDISFFGILFVYTSTAAKLLSVDDISIEAVDKIIKESDTEIILPDSQITGDDISSTSWDTINALKFSIQDVDITDNFPTYLQQIVVRNPQPAASSIWEKTIANAWLYNGDLQINSNVLIKNDSITFLFPNNLFIPSGEVVNLLMKISLTDSLTDNSTLQFKIDKNNHGCRASANGSGILPVLVNDIVSGIFTIRVDADTILLKDLPQQIVINSSFSISAIASDSLGNVDTDFSPSANLVLVSGSGNLIIEPISFQSGILIAENIKYNKAENILLKLSTTILSSTNASISVILDTTSIIEPPNSQYVGITIPSDAVSMETEMAVFKFIIKDIAGDGAPTIVEELRFENPLSATNLINVIGGISLYDGSRRLVTNILEQKREFMRIGLFAGTLAIEDGESKEITMKIHLKTKVADKTGLKFLIYSINHGSKASQNGSQFAGNFGQNIVSEDFTVEVDAKKLIFKTIPAAVVHGQAFGVEINAVSDDGTIDVDVTGNITLELIENEELLTCSSGLTKQMADGKAVWNDLIISSPVVFHIKAKHSALTLTETVSSDIAAMDLDSEILPVISQNRTIFKSTDTGAIVAKEVIRLILSDKGTRDGLPLIVDKMFFYSVSDFSILNATGGIELIVDNQNIPVTYSLTENKIQINPENLQIPDGGTKEIYLKIFLRGAKYRDGAKFQIYIPATNHGWTTKENSSQFAKTFNYSIYSEEHCIDVEAFGLIAVNQPVIVEKNQPFRIVVAAADCFGNIDTAFNHNIEIVQNTGAGYIHVIDTEQTKGVKTFELAYDSLNEFSLKSTTSLLEEVMFVPISAVNKIDTLVKQNITTWNNIGDWVWNGNKLKHNTGTGLSQVSAPINIDISNGMVQWDFELENGNFDPSADNAFCCVLSSDIEHFATNNFSGYLIGVNQTGASDLISFWKVKNGAKTILWSSNYDWNANTAVQIIVQRHEGEKWTIFIKEIGKSLQLAGTFTDKEFVDCKFSGFLFNYTTTRVGMLSINNYELTKINLPLKLNQAEILDKNSIRLVFNTNIDFSDALNFENYFLKSNLDTFAIIDAEQISDREIRLSTAMLSDTVFYLAISGIRDNAGIALKDTVLKLTRIAPNVNCVAKILNRSNLSLVFNTALVDTTSLKTANYKLINFENITFEIKNITKNFDTLYLVCDSLYGSGFMLHYNNLMTADAFVLNDSVLLTKEYLPAKI